MTALEERLSLLNQLVLAHGPSVLALIDAAQRYRAICLSDPTSLDRPTAGSDLDAALAPLVEEPRT